MAHYSLFVLKVLLNPKQTNKQLLIESDRLKLRCSVVKLWNVCNGCNTMDAIYSLCGRGMCSSEPKTFDGVL